LFNQLAMENVFWMKVGSEGIKGDIV
jgi:hypothetical protein